MEYQYPWPNKGNKKIYGFEAQHKIVKSIYNQETGRNDYISIYIKYDMTFRNIIMSAQIDGNWGVIIPISWYLCTCHNYNNG